MAVAFHWIVEHLNKIEYLALSFFSGCVDLSLNNPLFKCSKEAFSNGVIVAVSSTTHLWLEIVIPHKCQIVSAPVLAALIAVHQYCVLRLAPPHCHKQCPNN